MTKAPELALGDAFGESVQVELDFGLDDVSEGLWVEVRHHEPDEGSDGDPRERSCTLHADCHYGLVDAVDLDRIFCVLYEGQPRICRIAASRGAREPLEGLCYACLLTSWLRVWSHPFFGIEHESFSVLSTATPTRPHALTLSVRSLAWRS